MLPFMIQLYVTIYDSKHFNIYDSKHFNENTNLESK